MSLEDHWTIPGIMSCSFFGIGGGSSMAVSLEAGNCLVVITDVTVISSMSEPVSSLLSSL